MLSTIVGIIATALLAVVGWAFNLQSRVSVLEAEQDAEKASMRELLDAKLENITMRLARIERKLDKEQ